MCEEISHSICYTLYLWWKRKKFGHKQVSCTIIIKSVDVLMKCPFTMFVQKKKSIINFFFHVCVHFYPVLAMLTLYTCLFLSRPCNAHALYLFVFIPSMQCSHFILVCFYPVLAMLTLYTCLFLSRPCNAHALYLFVFIPSMQCSHFILVCFYPVLAMLTF